MLSRWLLSLAARRVADRGEEESRFVYGKLAGWAGLSANLLLFAAKLLAGALSGSISVIADAFNNLSDAGSSFVTLVGFKLAAAPADREHPFGHGRMEYLSTLAVGGLVLLAGGELLKSAIKEILLPQPAEWHWLSVAVLAAAIAVKLWMVFFYRKVNRVIHSKTLSAAAADSRNDILCTAVVLLSTLVGGFTSLSVDGYIGTAVALFVLWSGFSIMRDTVSPLLGEAPSPEFVEEVRQTVLAAEGIVGVHDLIVHNYGPGRVLLSLHAEVPCHEDLLKSHDRVDQIEKELARRFHASVCIHMDPIDTDDERVGELKMLTETVIHDIDPALSLHDFRVVFGETHSNVIFDVVVPFGFADSEGLPKEIERRLQLVDSRLRVVATVEHAYD